MYNRLLILPNVAILQNINDHAFDAVMKVLRKSEREILPNLTIPTLVEVAVEDKKYNVNKPYKIIFEQTNDEWIAVGTLLDRNQILKLTIQDSITCANNGWRFKFDCCLLAHNLHVNCEPISIHELIQRALFFICLFNVSFSWLSDKTYC